MSILGAVASEVETLLKDASGGNVAPLAIDLTSVSTAATNASKTVKAFKDGTMTPEQFLGAVDSLVKVVAIFIPGAAVLEPLIECEEAIAAVADALGLVKTDPGKPLGSDGINPYSGAPLGV